MSIGEEAPETEHVALARVVSVELGARPGVGRGGSGGVRGFSWRMSHRWAAFLDMGSGQLGLQVPTPGTALQTVAQGRCPAPRCPPKGSIPPKCLSLPIPSPSPRRQFTFKEALE